jgi:hypothetical protein
MTKIPAPGSPVTRRRVLQVGGLAVSFGAVLAACGNDDETANAPGRVGYAPPATPLPQVEENDVVYLRTATSMEYTLLDVYAAITESGELDAEAQALIDRFVENHTEDAAITARLTRDAGGEPYECANTWYVERVLALVIPNIEGDPSEDIPPSDDPARDMLAVSHALESLVGSMYQQFVELVGEPELRSELMHLGARDNRHAAAVAMLSTGVPEGYVSPELLGADVLPNEEGLNPLYAIATRFGQLGSTELVIGAPNEAGTRYTLAVETPAANSFVYEGETCEA